MRLVYLSRGSAGSEQPAGRLEDQCELRRFWPERNGVLPSSTCDLPFRMRFSATCWRPAVLEPAALEVRGCRSATAAGRRSRTWPFPCWLIDLSGVLRPAPEALRRVLLAWATTAPPLAALSAVAVMASVLTRSSVAGTGLPVLLALTMQLSTLVDGAQGTRRLLVTTGFEAWHGC